MTFWSHRVYPFLLNKKNKPKQKRNRIENGIISHAVLERWTLYFSSYKNWELKLIYDELELAKEKREHFL